MNYSKLIRVFVEGSILLSAVGGGADLVWDVDTALTGEGSSITSIETRERASGGLQAVASGLAVSGGACSGVDLPHSGTARWRWTSTTLNVRSARNQGARNRSTRDSSLRHGCYHHAQHHKSTHKLHASHLLSLKENTKNKLQCMYLYLSCLVCSSGEVCGVYIEDWSMMEW